jgi:hypothetical protein
MTRSRQPGHQLAETPDSLLNEVETLVVRLGKLLRIARLEPTRKAAGELFGEHLQLTSE